MQTLRRSAPTSSMAPKLAQYFQLVSCCPAAGDTVLRVPGRLLMTTRSARADPALAAALSRLAASPDPDDVAAAAALTPHQLLATHLLHEVSKGPESFWHPYLQQLPRSYTSLAHFSADDAAALQLQLAQDVAAAAAERAREEWQGALPLLRALGERRMEASARDAVTSRVVPIFAHPARRSPVSHSAATCTHGTPPLPRHGPRSNRPAQAFRAAALLAVGGLHAAQPHHVPALVPRRRPHALRRPTQLRAAAAALRAAARCGRGPDGGGVGGRCR